MVERDGTRAWPGTGRSFAIVVIGVSGSGKSTVGRRLASARQATFLEGDAYHPSANVAKMRAGVALTDGDRWPWLDKLGRAIAAHAARGRPVVAACSALRRVYREKLATAARHPLVFVHLVIDPATLEARMNARRQHFMPTSLLRSQLATLEPLGADEAGVEIHEAGSVIQTIGAIERWIRRSAHRRRARPHEKGRQRRPLVHGPPHKPKPVRQWRD